MIRTVENDVSLPTGVAKRGSNYHLQIKVPAHLQPFIKRSFWIRTSLGTDDRATAAALAHHHWAEASAAFAVAEAKLKPREAVPLTPALSAYLVKEAQRVPLAYDDVVRFEPGGLLWLLNSVEPQPIRFLTAPGDEPWSPPRPEYLNPSLDGLMTPAQLQRLQELQSMTVDDLGRAVSMGRLEAAVRFAEASCASLGVSVDWTIPANRPALIAILRELLGAWIGLSERSAGKLVKTPPAPEAPLETTGKLPTARAGKAVTMADAFAAWKKGKKADAVRKTERALAMLTASKQDRPLRDLTRQHGLAFREHINDTMAATSGKTRSDVLAAIQALLNFAVREKGWLGANPWAGTAIAKGRAKRRDPWDHAALMTLLHSPLRPDRRLDMASQYWIPLLALMTGARQAELCQLRVSDVLELDGVPLMDINEAADGKSVKSDAGVRRIAIHSKLVELGFLGHVQAMRDAGESLVFPGILTAKSRAASLYVSDWFRERCRTLGIYKRLRDFHAFRTTVGTALRAVEPPLGEALITAVMGHEAGNVGMSHYHRPLPKTLQRTIETLSFPAVMTLPRVFQKAI